MKQQFSLNTTVENFGNALRNRAISEFDIVQQIGEEDPPSYQSFFQDNGIKINRKRSGEKNNDQYYGIAIRKLAGKLLTEYTRRGQGEHIKKALTKLSNTRRENANSIVFEGLKEKPNGTEESLIRDVKNGEEIYYAVLQKQVKETYTLDFILNENGKIWKDKDGTPWVTPSNRDIGKYMNFLARICQAVIPEKEQENCFIEVEIEANGTPAADNPKTTKPVENFSKIGQYIKNNRQVIFTGAPGTGKTFGIREHIRRSSQATGKLMLDGEEIKQSEFVQFHSSYDYSDFVEGLRPVQVKDRQTQKKEVMFVRMDGIFKRFCRNIVEYNLQVLSEDNLLKDRSIETLMAACDLGEDAAEAEQTNKKNILKKINETKFYFVIDEINRADLGKVFGELMFGLEEAYRGVENRFPTQYANLPTYYVDPAHPEKNGFYRADQTDETNQDCINKEDVFARGFFIPENLHIVGSMNDIDRSVESFDFALRRRFKWIDIKANDCMHGVLTSMNEKREEEHKFDVDELFLRAKALNDVIWCKQGEGDAKKTGGNDVNLGAQFGLNEAFHIGPAYFKDYNPTDVDETWTSRIEPILREYVRGRDAKKVENFIETCRKAYTNVKPAQIDDLDKQEQNGIAPSEEDILKKPGEEAPGNGIVPLKEDGTAQPNGGTTSTGSAPQDGQDKA